MVDGDAVLERVRSAGVGGDVAADGAGALAARVRGVVVAVRLQGVGEPDVHDARLDDGVAVADIDFENAFHARQRDHHAAADQHASAGEARSGPAREEAHVEFVARLHDADDLLGAGGEYDHIGLRLGDGEAIALVDGHVRRGGEDIVVADDGLHPLHEVGVLGGGHRRRGRGGECGGDVHFVISARANSGW